MTSRAAQGYPRPRKARSFVGRLLVIWPLCSSCLVASFIARRRQVFVCVLFRVGVAERNGARVVKANLMMARYHHHLLETNNENESAWAPMRVKATSPTHGWPRVSISVHEARCRRNQWRFREVPLIHIHMSIYILLFDVWF